MDERPPHRYEAPPEGYEWKVCEDTDWQIGGAGRLCRHRSKVTCGRPAVARLSRGYKRKTWWAYCEEHLFGHWIENGRVVSWCLENGLSWQMFGVLLAVRRQPGLTAREYAYEEFYPDRSDVFHRRLPDLEKLNLVVKGEPRKCRISGRLAHTWRAV